jgi:hypothetical protein
MNWGNALPFVRVCHRNLRARKVGQSTLRLRGCGLDNFSGNFLSTTKVRK